MAAHHDFYRGSLIESYRFANVPQICANCERWSTGKGCTLSKSGPEGHCSLFRFSRNSKPNNKGGDEASASGRASSSSKATRSGENGIGITDGIATMNVQPGKLAKRAPSFFAAHLSEAKNRQAANGILRSICKSDCYHLKVKDDLAVISIPGASSHIEVCFNEYGATVARIDTATGQPIKEKHEVSFNAGSLHE